MPYGVEAREPGCWSDQKLQKMDFQNIRRAGRSRVELADKRGSVCHPSFRLQSLGEMACGGEGGGVGRVVTSWLAWAKLNHFQHNPHVYLHAAVCWAAAVWQLLEEGFHHTRLLLISPHLSCQGSDWKIILNAMGPAKKAIVFGRVSSKVRCFSKHWMKQDCLYISFKWECFSWTFSFYFWRNEKGSLKIQPEVNMLKHSQVHDV